MNAAAKENAAKNLRSMLHDCVMAGHRAKETGDQDAYRASVRLRRQLETELVQAELAEEEPEAE